MARSGYTVGVIGLGRVGLVWAAVMASRGFRVIGVDIDERRVDAVRRGVAPFYEPGLGELLERVVGEGLLEATTSYDRLLDADIVFIMVGTPSDPQGRPILSYVEDAARRLAGVIKRREGYSLVVVRSTVPPGTTRGLVGRVIEEVSGKRIGIDVGLAMNPEFVSEGNAVRDSLNPSRIVIGAVDERSAETLLRFYNELFGGKLPPVIVTSLENAELIKYASNAMLAARLALINAIALLAERTPNTDIDTIALGVGLDPRIGREYLRAGLGYGGSCLPKDLASLTTYAESLGIEPVARLLSSIAYLNDHLLEHAARVLEERLGGLEGRRIAVLGLAFKPGTDDTRESRGLRLALLLRKKGALVKAHDPTRGARESAAREGIEVTDAVEDALRGSEAAVIATPWEEYRRLDPRVFKKLMARALVLDPWRLYNRELLAKHGVELIQLGVYRG